MFLNTVILQKLSGDQLQPIISYCFRKRSECRILRLSINIFLAARELVRIDKKSLAPISSNEPISMSVGLMGVGPKFKLEITLTNTSDKVDLNKTYFLTFSYPSELYRYYIFYYIINIIFNYEYQYLIFLIYRFYT